MGQAGSKSSSAHHSTLRAQIYGFQVCANTIPICRCYEAGCVMCDHFIYGACVRYATRVHAQPLGKKRTEEERSEDARIAATFLTSLMEHNEKGEDNEGNFIVSIEFGSIEKREHEKLRQQ